MMDAVCEPDPLGVLDEFLEIFTVAIAGVGAHDRRQKRANAQVVLVILVVDDVPAGQGRLRQVVGQFLFPERQLVEAGNLVSQHLHVGKAVYADR